MPDYRSNQFVSDWLRPQAGELTNAPFSYPRRMVRYTDVDPSTGQVTRYTKKLDRGFMRNLMTDSMVANTVGDTSKSKKQRFNFQFNPQDIEQAVEMRSDIYFNILQDPAQYAQPMSAVATFNFNILLDRTMEVGNGASGRSGEEEKKYAPTTDPFGTLNPASDVYQFGVLSDIQVLYSIIGQGFSNDFIQDQLAQIKLQAFNDVGANKSLDETAKAVKRQEIESMTPANFAGSSNLGNSAFLIPMPVRVVFSELFMVDGFVTSTNVRYTKFNTNMVPIQASIGLSMNALYIGFARQDTFMTVQLKNTANEQQRLQSEQVGAQQELLNAAVQSANLLVFACNNDYNWADYANQSIRSFTYNGENGVGPRGIKIGFKDARAQKDTDKVLELFKNGASFSFSYAWRLQVRGAYDSKALADVDLKNIRKYTASVSNKPVIGDFSGTQTATDAKTWETIRSKNYKRTDSTDSQSLKNLSSGPLPDPVSGDGYGDKYYIVYVEVKVTIGSYTSTKSEFYVLKGTDQFKYETNMNWPNLSGVGGNNSSPQTGTKPPSTSSTKVKTDSSKMQKALQIIQKGA